MKLSTASFGQFLFILLWSLNAESQVQATVGLYGPDRYEGLPEICLMPMDFGYCRAKVQRYYFDIRRMKCTMFYWGGCAGNDNNFKSLEECNNFCGSAYEDHIQNEIVVGKEPATIKEPASRGNNIKYNTVNSRDSSSVPKSVPKFALKANVSSKETGYKSQFKASAKSFNVASKPTTTTTSSSSSSTSNNNNNSYTLDSIEDEDYDD